MFSIFFEFVVKIQNRFKSSRAKVFCKKDVLKNFPEFTKTCVRVSFLMA